MSVETCSHPEQCAEEAGWMFNPHKDGWIEWRANTIWNGSRQSQGVCHMFKCDVFGNRFIGNYSEICVRVSSENQLNKRWWEFWKWAGKLRFLGNSWSECA